MEYKEELLLGLKRLKELSDSQASHDIAENLSYSFDKQSNLFTFDS